jgi:hypothetical protein
VLASADCAQALNKTLLNHRAIAGLRIVNPRLGGQLSRLRRREAALKSRAGG